MKDSNLSLDEDVDIDVDTINLTSDDNKAESLVIEERLNKNQLEEIYKIFKNVPR